MSRSGFSAPSCIPARVPGTVLATLLQNGTFPGVDLANVYFEDNLARIPDINVTGALRWTFWFRTSFEVAVDPSCSVSSPKKTGGNAGGFLRLNFRSINYELEVYINGNSVAPAHLLRQKGGGSLGAQRATGMYHRFSYPVPVDWSRDGTQEITVAALFMPPKYHGSPGGQGGDHEIAKNGAEMQFGAGWDWIQATPDRNTGPWDEVSVSASGPLILSDPLVKTTSIENSGDATLEFSLFVENLDKEVVSGEIVIETESTSASLFIVIRPGEKKEAVIPNVNLANATLWWPHTHGEPHLYAATAKFVETHENGPTKAGAVLATLEWPFGVATVEYEVNNAGRIFKVNGQKIFLQGGNWIATDQLLRYSTDSSRYYAEVRAHKEMGFNMIRVWGGGIAERPKFYEACDRLGVLVMQEFWMTGDNNGRWAGNYSWPLNHNTYLESALDTILMIRRHVSLLFWNAGNELYPLSKSPPSDILLKLQEYVTKYHSNRLLVMSSMTNYTDFDPVLSLAPKDGPYGFLSQEEWYERNPGLFFWNNTRAENLTIGFQPEVGSVSTPTFESMLKFMGEGAMRNFPRDFPNAEVDPIWEYHKFLPYNGGVNAFGKPTEARDYAFRAQLAQFTQYRNLFEGFQERMWNPISAILMWKSQSPWPTFRGALYDTYLAPTGGYYGARAACTAPIHVQLNLKNFTVAIVNKSPREFKRLFVSVNAFDLLSSGAPQKQSIRLGPFEVPANSVLSDIRGIEWPNDLRAGMRSVLLWRLALEDNTTVLDINEYWQSHFDAPQNYSSLARLREDPGVPKPKLNITILDQDYESWDFPEASGEGEEYMSKMKLKVQIQTVLDKNGENYAAFGVRITLRNVSFSEGLHAHGSSDDRVLPSWISASYFTVLPGETKVVMVEFAMLETSKAGRSLIAARKRTKCPTTATRGLPQHYAVEADGWNTEPVRACAQIVM